MEAKEEPFVVLAYGASGVGKTTDMGYSFPTALFLAAPGSLNSVASVCGYKPKSLEVKTIPDIMEVLKKVKQSKKFDTIVIDDFSFVTEQTLSFLESKGFKGFVLWGKLRDLVLQFRNDCRYSGVNVVLNSWEQGAKKKENGQEVQGGPKLTGNLPEQIPALCDLVVRAVPEQKRKPWPGAYRCFLSEEWALKDRFNVAYHIDPCPMNLGELLRASGKVVRRIYDTQEEEVEELVSGSSDYTDVFTGIPDDDNEKAQAAFSYRLQKGDDPLRARWTVRDALDRAVIRHDLNRMKNSFFTLPNVSTTLG